MATEHLWSSSQSRWFSEDFLCSKGEFGVYHVFFLKSIASIQKNCAPAQEAPVAGTFPATQAMWTRDGDAFDHRSKWEDDPNLLYLLLGGGSTTNKLGISSISLHIYIYIHDYIYIYTYIYIYIYIHTYTYIYIYIYIYIFFNLFLSYSWCQDPGVANWSYWRCFWDRKPDSRDNAGGPRALLFDLQGENPWIWSFCCWLWHFDRFHPDHDGAAFE